ncbi:LacI family DNA-binding transcriptional regulator [Luedemannella helvata]|uniref:LacI family DNA-binding transcriptional regulator n=1 Tax=Luedemannella helvata TaxID=349315 RepID=A0ABN2KAG9_9ACTN
MSRSVTIEDVARRAGTSRATASRVLAGSASVSDSARDRVTRAAADLGYVPNALARALASGRGDRIVLGIVSPQPVLAVDLYLGRAVTAATQAANAAGVGVSVRVLPIGAPDPLADLATDRTVCGVILFNTTYALLKSVPRALTGRAVSIGVGSDIVPSVDVDNGGAARKITDYLYATGHREIAMIGGPEWMPCTARARRAYSEVMASLGLPARIVYSDFSATSGREGAARLLATWPETDAIYAVSDTLALGVLSLLGERGIDVPGAVAVVGFDDIPYAEVGWPPLTTATHPVESIVEYAVQTVLAGRPGRAEDRLFDSHLVLRRSA